MQVLLFGLAPEVNLDLMQFYASELDCTKMHLKCKFWIFLVLQETTDSIRNVSTKYVSKQISMQWTIKLMSRGAVVSQLKQKCSTYVNG